MLELFELFFFVRKFEKKNVIWNFGISFEIWICFVQFQSVIASYAEEKKTFLFSLYASRIKVKRSYGIYIYILCIYIKLLLVFCLFFVPTQKRVFFCCCFYLINSKNLEHWQWNLVGIGPLVQRKRQNYLSVSFHWFLMQKRLRSNTIIIWL